MFSTRVTPVGRSVPSGILAGLVQPFHSLSRQRPGSSGPCDDRGSLRRSLEVTRQYIEERDPTGERTVPEGRRRWSRYVREASPARRKDDQRKQEGCDDQEQDGGHCAEARHACEHDVSRASATPSSDKLNSLSPFQKRPSRTAGSVPGLCGLSFSRKRGENGVSNDALLVITFHDLAYRPDLLHLRRSCCPGFPCQPGLGRGSRIHYVYIKAPSTRHPSSNPGSSLRICAGGSQPLDLEL